MEIEKSKSGANLLKLPATLDLAAADSLHAAGLQAVGLGEDLRLDAGEVAKVSTACLQILVAMDIKLAGDGHSLAFEGVSDVLKESLLDLGMNEYLDKWSR